MAAGLKQFFFITSAKLIKFFNIHFDVLAHHRLLDLMQVRQFYIVLKIKQLQKLKYESKKLEKIKVKRLKISKDKRLISLDR